MDTVHDATNTKAEEISEFPLEQVEVEEEEAMEEDAYETENETEEADVEDETDDEMEDEEDEEETEDEEDEDENEKQYYDSDDEDYWEFVENQMGLLREHFPLLSAEYRYKTSNKLWQELLRKHEEVALKK